MLLSTSTKLLAYPPQDPRQWIVLRQETRILYPQGAA